MAVLAGASICLRLQLPRRARSWPQLGPTSRTFIVCPMSVPCGSPLPAVSGGLVSSWGPPALEQSHSLIDKSSDPLAKISGRSGFNAMLNDRSV